MTSDIEASWSSILQSKNESMNDIMRLPNNPIDTVLCEDELESRRSSGTEKESRICLTSEDVALSEMNLSRDVITARPGKPILFWTWLSSMSVLDQLDIRS